MDDYGELPDLKMSALAIIFQTKWKSKVNKTNDFVVKEALALFASSLEDDDIGYFYDPKAPNDLCVNAGGLVGKIANSTLPYGFDFHQGLKHLVKMLNAVDDDYNRVCVIVSDCLSAEDVVEMKNILSVLHDSKVYIIAVGKCALDDGIEHIQDAVELADKLTEIRDSLGFAK